MADAKQTKLARVLVDEGVITEEQLDQFMEEQENTEKFIVEIIAEHTEKKEEELTQILSARLGFAYIDMETMTVEPKVMELDIEEICVKCNVLPLYVMNDTLTVAMANPLDTDCIEELQTVTELKVRPAFAAVSAIREAIKKHFKSAEAEEKLAGQMGAVTETGNLYEGLGESMEVSTEQVASLKEAASLAPVVDLVNKIITKAVDMAASDIHLEPQRENLTCRYRIDGVLHLISRIDYKYLAAVLSRIKIMANMDIAEKRLPQDGRIRMMAGTKEVDLRVSTFPTIYGENLVIRILDRSTGIVELKQLGFEGELYKHFVELIRKPYGIILVTGPTGSGKTTTLYAALSDINSVEKNIMTMEDPVEYEIADVRQAQVNVKAGLTFAAGLRSTVRQDPDIIMIGEIRDKETAEIGIHAALTGHLVFSTLHTNDAPSAAARMIDMGVEPFLVASSVIGIIAQRLIRTLCDACKAEYKPSKDLAERLGIPEFTGKFYKEVGCKKCKQRGYAGREGIFELLLPNDKIKELISQKASSSILRDAAIANGMKTLRDSGVDKVVSGKTSVSELIRVTEE
ncbi:MAG: ATPase, T2SS/T4P/T4SS family [Candidatus Omnitrophota bacterium]